MTEKKQMASPASHNRIAELRALRGWSQKELADRVGTTPQQIGHLEAGRRRLTMDWMARLASALDCLFVELVMDGAREASDEELVINWQRTRDVAFLNKIQHRLRGWLTSLMFADGVFLENDESLWHGGRRLENALREAIESYRGAAKHGRWVPYMCKMMTEELSKITSEQGRSISPEARRLLDPDMVDMAIRIEQTPPPPSDEIAPTSERPRGLTKEAASMYLGIPIHDFDQLVADGLMPTPKRLGSHLIWDKDMIDKAFSALPAATEPARLSAKHRR